MKVLVDLNVLLDVVQKRGTFYESSARVLTSIVRRELSGFLPSHALTTLHYIVKKHAGLDRANAVVDWALAHLTIVPQDQAVFVRARSLDFDDFEDAAVASAAEAAGCAGIVTRNVTDFRRSPVPIFTPEELLARG